MAEGLIVSVSGIRGRIGVELTDEIARQFASALATTAPPGPIVLSRDGRPSGSALARSATAGLTNCGRQVIDIGVAPTPTCGLAVRRLAAAGAIQITASHNPADWNGLKLFDPAGRVLPAVAGQAVKQVFESREFVRVPAERVGRVQSEARAPAWHRDRILELLDVQAIRACRFRILVDANGGAGGPLALDLLAALGCDLVPQACQADGRFVHEPEPIEPNLRDIAPLVPRSLAAIGFVLDPDADRLAIIDEAGRYIGEELTLALAVKYRLGQARGPVVINMSTSRITEDIAKTLGVECLRSAVGEANVAGRMVEVGALIGGEGNGGVIDPRVGLVRDPFTGIGLILSLLAESGQPLSRIVAGLPAYSIVKEKYEVARDRLPGLFVELGQLWPEARANTLDGLRLDWPDRWVHVRPSNTEPIIRVIAEAPSTEAAASLCRAVAEQIAYSA